MPKKKHLSVAVIGCGNIGEKRTRALLELGEDKIAGFFDINLRRAETLAKLAKAKVYPNWRAALLDPLVNAVIVATTTDVNVRIVLEALKLKKHVLAEKPLGKDVVEAAAVARAAKKSGRVLKIGYNHRHHPAIAKAYELAKTGVIGKILYIRCVYGHGARPGYDTEWRMQKKFAPGGELYDQGVHIIDLANWFLGNFTSVFCQTRNFYWRKSELEDNAFCQLYTKGGQLVDFHVSLTQWRNRFSFEIFGDKGYLAINGKGGAYGTETLTLGTEVGLGRAPKEKVFEFFGNDISWKGDWQEFRLAVINKRTVMANPEDNLVVNKILENLYQSAKKGKIIKNKF